MKQKLFLSFLVSCLLILFVLGIASAESCDPTQSMSLNENHNLLINGGTYQVSVTQTSSNFLYVIVNGQAYQASINSDLKLVSGNVIYLGNFSGTPNAIQLCIEDSPRIIRFGNMNNDSIQFCTESSASENCNLNQNLPLIKDNTVLINGNEYQISVTPIGSNALKIQLNGEVYNSSSNSEFEIPQESCQFSNILLNQQNMYSFNGISFSISVKQTSSKLLLLTVNGQNYQGSINSDDLTLVSGQRIKIGNLVSPNNAISYCIESSNVSIKEPSVNVNQNITCHDTGNGNNLFASGLCTGPTGNFSDYCDAEKGGTNPNLIEKVSCENVTNGSPEILGKTVCVYHTQTCPFGCKAGVCIKIKPNSSSNQPVDINQSIENISNETVKQELRQNVNYTSICEGCVLDSKCYPLGFRKDSEYCDDNSSNFINQKASESLCENNFECSSNVCVSGKCIDEGFLQKIINWFKDLFG